MFYLAVGVLTFSKCIDIFEVTPVKYSQEIWFPHFCLKKNSIRKCKFIFSFNKYVTKRNAEKFKHNWTSYGRKKCSFVVKSIRWFLGSTQAYMKRFVWIGSHSVLSCVKAFWYDSTPAPLCEFIRNCANLVYRRGITKQFSGLCNESIKSPHGWLGRTLAIARTANALAKPLPAKLLRVRALFIALYANIWTLMCPCVSLYIFFVRASTFLFVNSLIKAPFSSWSAVCNRFYWYCSSTM